MNPHPSNIGVIMAKIEGRAYRITDTSRWLFTTLFPEMDPEAKYFLVSPAGTLTFTEDPPLRTESGEFRIPHLELLSYFNVDFEDE